MEKITHPPLIKHLKDEEAYYEHLLVGCEIKNNPVSGELISAWMVKIIEPLIVTLAQDDFKETGKLCKAFFNELLTLSQKGDWAVLSISYHKLWLMTPDIADIFKSSPDKILLAFSSAIHSIHRYQPQGLDGWLNLMAKLLPVCKTLDDVLSSGRIASWVSGMAHLREIAWQNYQGVSENLKKAIQVNFNAGRSFEKCINTPWNYQGSGETESFGGFIGLNKGLFKRPPVVAGLSSSIVATDGENSCALFADTCGKVVLENISINAAQVLNVANSSNEEPISNKLKNKYRDLSSVVVINTLIVFTRATSFKVFIEA